MKIQIQTGSPWENKVGYCRALRIGAVIEVAGTTAVDKDGNVVAPGDAATQTRFIFRKIEQALLKLDSSLASVIRTRMFVTDISCWEAVGKVHGEFFGEIRPVATLVEVSALIHPELVIEIEVTAYQP